MSGRFHAMPNIRQQKKRVRSAARQRLENLRYRSTVKTLTRRLRDAVADGDAEKVAAEHAALVREIDQAATRGALHRGSETTWTVTHSCNCREMTSLPCL